MDNLLFQKSRQEAVVSVSGSQEGMRVMDGSTLDPTHPPFRQQAAVGGSRASSKATHAPSAKLWKQVNVHRFPPVFSPQTGRSTEGLRFQVGLLKTAPESPTVDAVELLHPLGSWTWRSVRRQALTR